MRTLNKNLTLLVPCPRCHVGTGDWCVTRNGTRATYLHGDRRLIAERIRLRLSTSWQQGHAACSHSCTTYAGLGKPCTNPYEVFQ